MMEITFWVPIGTDVSAVAQTGWEPQLDSEGGGKAEYFVGSPTDGLEAGDVDAFPLDEAITTMGFIEGRFPDGRAMVDGHGPWANGMFRRRDFSGLAIDDATRASYEARSRLYWAGHAQGSNGGQG